MDVLLSMCIRLLQNSTQPRHWTEANSSKAPWFGVSQTCQHVAFDGSVRFRTRNADCVPLKTQQVKSLL